MKTFQTPKVAMGITIVTVVIPIAILEDKWRTVSGESRRSKETQGFGTVS
jgi:hypothetical protein